MQACPAGFSTSDPILTGPVLNCHCCPVMDRVQFFVRDILGMAGGIMFAYAAGSNFDSNAKQWRLFADIMNDLGEQQGLTGLVLVPCFATPCTWCKGGAGHSMTQPHVLGLHASCLACLLACLLPVTPTRSSWK